MYSTDRLPWHVIKPHIFFSFNGILPLHLLLILVYYLRDDGFTYSSFYITVLHGSPWTTSKAAFNKMVHRFDWNFLLVTYLVHTYICTHRRPWINSDLSFSKGNGAEVYIPIQENLLSKPCVPLGRSFNSWISRFIKNFDTALWFGNNNPEVVQQNAMYKFFTRK